MAGLAVGTTPWPMKLMRRFQYEHWAFIAMLFGLIIAPWMVTLLGVAVMILGVLLISVAGLERSRALRKEETQRGGFGVGLMMAILAGVLSAGISFTFVYSQGPIMAAMIRRGAGDIPANVAVWAAGLLAGATLNVLYPAYLMIRNRSWGVLAHFNGRTR